MVTLTLDEKNLICPESIRYGESRDGSDSLGYISKNVGKGKVRYDCIHKRGKKSKCGATLNLNRDKETGVVDQGNKILIGSPTRGCCYINGVDTSTYQWDGKRVPEDKMDGEVVENQDPNVSPSKVQKVYDNRVTFTDVGIEALQLVDDMATSTPTTPPRKLWLDLQKVLDEKYPDGWSGVKKLSIIERIRRVRSEINHSDAFRTVETTSYGQMTDTKRPFLQHHSIHPDHDKPGEYQRNTAFANPENVFLLGSKALDIYVDATFESVPRPFYQCLVIIIFDVQTNTYVPVVYVLMTHKTQELYWHAFNALIVISKWILDVATYTSDFEKALFNAARNQFGRNLPGLHVGCLFHLKQAWRRCLISVIGFWRRILRWQLVLGIWICCASSLKMRWYHTAFHTFDP